MQAVQERAAEERGPGPRVGDRAWSILLGALGGAVLLIAGLILAELLHVSGPALSGARLWAFVTSADWDPVAGSFGAQAYVYGTLVTSVLALLLAVPVSLGLALFVTEMAPAGLRPLVSFPLELLAGIPSVVYGLWGLFVLVPALRDHLQPFLQRWLGFLPLFQGPAIGIGFLAGGVLLAIMILPTVTSISIEVLRTVPGSLREASLALGATRWEMIRTSVLPYARAGLIGAVMLGLGRALGETMAVTMVIGNSPIISPSLFSPGYSLPAVIANEFAEASGELHTGALAALGLILFGVTMLLNALARLLVQLVRRGPARVAP